MAGNDVRIFLRKVFWYIYDDLMTEDERTDLRNHCKERAVHPSIKQKWRSLTTAQREHIKRRFEAKHSEDIKYLESLEDIEK